MASDEKSIRMERRRQAIWLTIIALLSHITPKVRGRVVFASIQFDGKLAGNLKPVLLAISADLASVEAVWAASSTSTAKKVIEAGGRAVVSRMFWAWPMLRAEWVFVDGVRSPLGLGKFRFVQTWHGTGFKKIGTENPNRSLLGAFLVRRFGRMTELLTANSIEDAERKQGSLHVANVQITGAPRVDALFRSSRRSTENDENCRKVFAYVPTFRDGGMEKQPFTLAEWQMLDALMEECNGSFLVKRHPSDKSLKVPGGLRYLHDVTDQVEDVQDFLVSADLIVSDYSGIVTDFVALSKPVVWYVPDLEYYLANCRDFYYEFPDILPGPVVNNFEDLIARILDCEWFCDSDYQDRYQEFTNRFHAHKDDGSTGRVVDAFKTLISR